MSTPFYNRPLDDFADHIICRVIAGSNGSYNVAVLDTGPIPFIWVDFSTYATTPEEAIKKCAAKIRDDHKGIGKFAPHSCLQGYTLNFQLKKWWAEKESLVVHS